MELQQRRTIVTGALLLSNIMAGMDGTIVNTALPAITSDLHGLQYMGWIIATFLLGMAVATPFWSKFGEHKGNKQAYITATSMFLVGAIFQGLAPNILWFIIARTVMGIGAGGMNTIPFIVFAELYDNLKKRAQVLGIASACFGTASIIGPLLGGWIVDALSWHWVFYVNVPIALIAITIISLFYKNVKKQAAGKPVDYLGATLLVVSLVMILVAFVIVPVEHWARVQGFGTEDAEEIVGFSLQIGIPFLQMSIAAAIFSTLGAIAEASMAIATACYTLIKQNEQMTPQQLYHDGITAGKDIIGTTLNTLFFGFFGGFLALFIWFVGLHYRWGTVINDKVFIAEILLILFAIIGVVLTVPVTAWLMSKQLHAQQIDNKHNK